MTQNLYGPRCLDKKAIEASSVAISLFRSFLLIRARRGTFRAALRTFVYLRLTGESLTLCIFIFFSEISSFLGCLLAPCSLTSAKTKTKRAEEGGGGGPARYFRVFDAFRVSAFASRGSNIHLLHVHVTVNCENCD